MKWNDFTSNASKAFSSLRNEDYLHNVTLVSNDNQQVSAHKLVLSACSEYFRNIFKNNPNNHPLICIDGVTKEELTNILDYMYNGEAHVYQDNLDRFLKIAERFKIQGLLGGLPKEETTEDNKAADRKEEFHYVDVDVVDETGKLTPKVELEVATQEKVQISAENITEIEEKISEYLEKIDGGAFRCTICGKEGNRSRNVKNHIETHMEGLSFPCGSCGKIFRSRITLFNHTNSLHKVKEETPKSQVSLRNLLTNLKS